MAGKNYIFVAFCCFLLIVNFESTSADDEIPGSWICNGTDGDNRCSLNCLLYPMYTSGYCSTEKRCTCVRRPPNQTSTTPVVYGTCAAVDGDNKCFLTCLFFDRFKSGFCQYGLCLCTPK